jgi:hypothetical protein
MKVRPHDSDSKVRKVNLTYNENYAVSVAEDGTMYVSELYPAEIIKCAESDSKVPPPIPDQPKKELGAGSLGLENKLPFHVPLKEDSADPEEYSLQMDKLQTDEDKKRRLADAKKEKKREEIAELRKKFNEILTDQNRLEDKHKLTPEEMRVDQQYYGILLKRNDDLKEEVHKEVAWFDEYYE